MATRYDSFSMFMADVVDQTKQKYMRKFVETSLPLGNFIWKICHALFTVFGGGWCLFLAVCALLVLGPIAFCSSVAVFLASPLGFIIIGLGGATILWTLYKHKKLPLAIKKTGIRYKGRYEQASGDREHIDNLVNEAAENLLYELR